MNRTNEQIPQILRPPENPQLYSLSSRFVAGMMRMGILPLYMGFKVGQRLYSPLAPVAKYALNEVERSPGFYIWMSALAATGLLAAFSLALHWC